VIHTVLEKEIQRPLRVCVRNAAEGRCTEDRAGALVARAAEWRLCDQMQSLPLLSDEHGVAEPKRRRAHGADLAAVSYRY
jgi:hypothetical protein